MFLTQLKRVAEEFERYDIDEAIAALAVTNMVKAGFMEREIEVPEYIANLSRHLDKYITVKARDELERKAKKVDLQLQGLRSRDEVRQDLLAEQKRLKDALAK